MVSVLHLLSYVGGLAGFLFVTLSLGEFTFDFRPGTDRKVSS